MKKLSSKLKRDNRGLSLVELLCAVAILSVISIAIGSAMSVSADSYRQGTREAALQQEAQFAANTIGNLIISANDEVTYSGNVLTVKNKDGAVETEYKIWLDSGELKYSKKQSGGSIQEGLVASGVDTFFVNTDDISSKISRNAYVEVVMKRDGKKISATYDITSRNDPSSNTAAEVTASAVIDAPSEVTMEPGETLAFDVSVTAYGGASSNYSASAVGASDTRDTKAMRNGDQVEIIVSRAEKGGDFGVLIQTTDGLASKTVTVHVRRVKKIEVSLSSTPLYGTALKSGAVYEATATVTDVTYPAKVLAGKSNDTNWVDPYGATWSFSLDSSYIKVLSMVEDGPTPAVRFQLLQDINPGTTCSVTATAKHPEGTVGGVRSNKTGTHYGEVTDTVTDPDGHVSDTKSLQQRTMWMDSDFLRGHDFDGLKYDSSFFSGKTPAGDQYIFRMAYCEATLNAAGTEAASYIGSWSAWISTGEGDNSNGGGTIWIRPSMTSLALNPAKAYAIRVCILKGSSYSNISYPSNWNNCAPEDAVGKENVFEFVIPAVSINVYDNASYKDGNGNNFPMGDKWALSDAPVFYAGDNYSIPIISTAAHMDKLVNGEIVFRCYQKTDGDETNLSTGWTWKKDFSIGYEGEYTGRIDNVKIGDQNDKNNGVHSDGLYKFVVEFKDGGYWKNSTPGQTVDYDHTDDRGVYYFRVKFR